MDADDVTMFLQDFGRGQYFNPCPACEVGDWCVYQEGRFTDNGNGTVTDNNTGLVWLKDANCFGSQYWRYAKLTADSLDSDTDPCGLTDGSHAGDWRLPTKEEWEEFVCTQYYRPAVCNTERTGQWSEADPFNDISTGMGVDYWTGTPTHPGYDNVWIMNLTNGETWNHPDTVTCLVWPVRGGH